MRFEMQMHSLGSGSGLFVYCDEAVAKQRSQTKLPPSIVGSLALAPADMTRFRAHAMLFRAGIDYSPEPILYHIPETARAADPRLPPWLFSRLLFTPGGRAGGVTDPQSSTVRYAACAYPVPPLYFSFVVQWHRDFVFHPKHWRRDSLPLPQGRAGVVACNRVFVTFPHAETDALTTAGFWAAAGLTVWQRSTEEIEVAFPGGGPALHFRAVRDLQAAQMSRDVVQAQGGGPPRRVTGWEWAVMDLQSATATVIDAAPGARIVTSASSADRVVIDMWDAGAAGLSIHLVSATPEQRALASAAAERLQAIRDASTAAACLLDSRGRHAYAIPPGAAPPDAQRA